ncbi:MULTISPECIES: hypothetical protein [Protofrankia]|uniref:hypothetical protein n=1 Tax=Protofrankia TaxID=2994361 RepID=UPI0013F1478E|nr:MULTISPECIES: hypothetical protein [Protofrankia]
MSTSPEAFSTIPVPAAEAFCEVILEKTLTTPGSTRSVAADSCAGTGLPAAVKASGMVKV